MLYILICLIYEKRIILKFHRTLLCPLITTKTERIPPFEKGGPGGISKSIHLKNPPQSWGDENHQKTVFKLIPFLFLIIQAEQKWDQFFTKIYGNFHQPTSIPPFQRGKYHFHIWGDRI
jgi:hypothetical protein